MNCPQCDERAVSRGGGGTNVYGKKRRYYHCRECDCNFEVIEGVIRIQGDDPLPFRNLREARRVLMQSAANDKEWFGELTEETREIARQVLTVYLIGKRSKPAARTSQQVRPIKRGVGRRALGVGR